MDTLQREVVAGPAPAHSRRPISLPANDKHPHQRPKSSAGCPKPQPLAGRAKWTRRAIAHGVELSHGIVHDRTTSGGPGVVDIEVLRVETTARNLSFAPLVDHWAQRSPLSRLAEGRPRLVAATDTGLYDFYDGAPWEPVIVHGAAGVLGSNRSQVIGFSGNRRLESGRVWLDGSISVGGRPQEITSVNDTLAPRGLSIFTPRWGQSAVQFAPDSGSGSLSVIINHGRVTTPAGSLGVPPRHGQLLVASTPTTEKWLQTLHSGERVNEKLIVKTDAPRRFHQAYGVETRLVFAPGTVNHDLGCDERDPQAARTAVGYADQGRQLIVAIVEDHPGTPEHGVDHAEMARLMSDLGAFKAWEWDGSGSAEMLARSPSTHRLSVLTYPADGVERPMPLGFGIFSKRPRNSMHSLTSTQPRSATHPRTSTRPRTSTAGRG